MLCNKISLILYSAIEKNPFSSKKKKKEKKKKVIWQSRVKKICNQLNSHLSVIIYSLIPALFSSPWIVRSLPLCKHMLLYCRSLLVEELNYEIALSHNPASYLIGWWWNIALRRVLPTIENPTCHFGSLFCTLAKYSEWQVMFHFLISDYPYCGENCFCLKQLIQSIKI